MKPKIIGVVDPYANLTQLTPLALIQELASQQAALRLTWFDPMLTEPAHKALVVWWCEGEAYLHHGQYWQNPPDPDPDNTDQPAGAFAEVWLDEKKGFYADDIRYFDLYADVVSSRGNTNPLRLWAYEPILALPDEEAISLLEKIPDSTQVSAL